MNDPIKAKIQELCPDVMELRFGCEALLGGHQIFITKAQTIPAGVVSKNIVLEMNTTLGIVFSDDQNLEILGSPITLAVVLRAIEKTVLNRCIFVSASGRFYEERAGQNVQLMPGKWNLSQDSYDNQTRETQLFIGSLLGVEK